MYSFTNNHEAISESGNRASLWLFPPCSVQSQGNICCSSLRLGEIVLLLVYPDIEDVAQLIGRRFPGVGSGLDICSSLPMRL